MAIKIVLTQRIKFLFKIFTFALICLVIRLGYIQLYLGEDLKQKATDYRTKEITVESKRGVIYDRNMIVLASSISTESVYAIPNNINKEKKSGTAKKLAKVLNLNADEVFKQIGNDHSFVWIKRKVSWDKVQELKKLDLEGIRFVEESRRTYPQQTLAAHVLGFTGIDNQGIAGIEKKYDEILRGTLGRVVFEQDAAGRILPNTELDYVPPEPSKNIVLTIDRTIQYFVERELDQIVEQYQPTDATIIVMEPHTGEILAMGNRPSFNPNNWQKYNASVWNQNPAIWYNYEPGSTFKTITLASALEEGVVNENSTFYDPGYVKVMGQTIRCWQSWGHGYQTLLEIAQNSCNPGFIEVGSRLGKDKFYKYINGFGFGQLTGIELSGESQGIMISKKHATPLNIATMSIGQSIAVTPIQLVTALSATINGGNLMKPHIIKEIKDEDNEVTKKIEPVKVRQVISEQTSKRVRAILETVVSQGGGKYAQIDGYTAGGKTGTAQVVGEKGGYVNGKYVSSFSGFAPATDPKITVLIVVREPKGSNYYGSAVAAPVFSSLAHDILQYLKVPQDNVTKEKKEVEKQLTEVVIPNIIYMPLSEAKATLEKSNLTFIIKGKNDNNIVYGQNFAPGKIVNQGTVVELDLTVPTNMLKGKVIVPNLHGTTMKESSQILEKLRLKFTYNGSGLAIGQNIKSGQLVSKDTKIEVTFAPDGLL